MLIFVTRKANSVELAENLKSNDFKGERGRDVINLSSTCLMYCSLFTHMCFIKSPLLPPCYNE